MTGAGTRLTSEPAAEGADSMEPRHLPRPPSAISGIAPFLLHMTGAERILRGAFVAIGAVVERAVSPRPEHLVGPPPASITLLSSGRDERNQRADGHGNSLEG
jgi:hypothetical protein